MLSIVIGCMFSGKTSYLLDIIQQLKEKNDSFLVINHISDSRYNDNSITNHNKKSENAFSLHTLKEFDICILDKINYLLIDESQFFTDLYDNVLKFLNYKKSLNIIIVGLDGDYKQNVFNDGQLLKLIPHCEKLTKLYSTCYKCGKKASFTKRIIDDTQQIIVGDNNIYKPSCYEHLKTQTC